MYHKYRNGVVSMKSCFLFGHADCPDDILLRIEAAIEKIYVQREVSVFYVGDRGRFDSLAATAVKRVKLRHPDIQLHLLLAYHPGERTVNLTDGFDGSYYPPLEGMPRQYAIVRANKFMIGCADAFICYVKHLGNTRKLLEYAQKRQKKEGVPIENVAEED